MRPVLVRGVGETVLEEIAGSVREASSEISGLALQTLRLPARVLLRGSNALWFSGKPGFGFQEN